MHRTIPSLTEEDFSFTYMVLVFVHRLIKAALIACVYPTRADRAGSFEMALVSTPDTEGGGEAGHGSGRGGGGAETGQS